MNLATLGTARRRFARPQLLREAITTDAIEPRLPDCKPPATRADHSARHTTNSETHPMISPALTYITARQQIAERHLVAADHRAAHPIREPRTPDTKAGRVSLRWLRPRDCK
jgi:hypothetical protein